MQLINKATIGDTEYALWCFGISTPPAQIAWERLAKVSSEAFRRLARANKVTEIITTNLHLNDEQFAQYPAYAEILQLLEQEALARHQRTEIVKEESRELRDFCQQQAIQIQFIKGVARGPLYPSDYTRAIGDIDIFVADCAAAERLIQWLHTRGFGWDVDEFPWIKRWSPGGDGRWYGQVSLYKPLSSAIPYIRADLHFGAYSVGQGGVVPLEMYTEHPVEMEMVILLGHAFGDGYFRIKDLNDWRLLAAHKSINWQIVTEQLALLQLSYMLPAIQELDAWQRRLASGAIEVFRGNFSINKTRRFKRAVRVAKHTFTLARQWEAPLQALKIAGEALFYYMRSHQLHPTGGFPHSPEFASEKLKRWTCWRLIPIGQKAQKKHKSFQILGANFWPTIWYDVPPDVLKEQATKVP